uniref:Homeobox protein HAT3.1 n=1 Tax=Rhizophora mucronata TaxID=61149 RepID=A0A2P2JAU2_RHIMU
MHYQLKSMKAIMCLVVVAKRFGHHHTEDLERPQLRNSKTHSRKISILIEL